MSTRDDGKATQKLRGQGCIYIVAKKKKKSTISMGKRRGNHRASAKGINTLRSN